MLLISLLVLESLPDGGSMRMSALPDQMVEGDEAVGLASSESGLGLDHRISSGAVQPLDCVDQKSPHSWGDIRPVEEADGVPVLGIVSSSVVHPLQTGGEFGLAEPALGYILVGADDVAPWAEVAGSWWWLFLQTNLGWPLTGPVHVRLPLRCRPDEQVRP